MNLTELSVKKPVFAWMVMAFFIIFGGISFTQIGVSERPDIDFPVVNISVTWEGAAPEVIELDILDQVESSVLGVEGIKSVTSEARRGQGNVTVEFGLDKNIDVAVQEVQSVLGQAMRRLPDDIEPPVIRKSNPEDRPIMWLSVTSREMSKRELVTYVRDFIKDRFQTVVGVSEIILGGYVEPNLRVWIDQDKLRTYDLSALDVINTIQREHLEVPAGIFENPLDEFNVRMLGEATEVEDFAKLSINQRGGAPNYSPIPLSAVAKIEDSTEDVRRLVRVNGIPSIGLGIRKVRGSNAVEVASAIKQRMSEVSDSLPEGLEIGINYDGTTFIEVGIEELQTTLILAAVMTALVVWLFLGSLSTTFNVVLSIPTAIVGTFIGMKAFDFTLNTFTMLGLTLAVGLIVDDNIMILENITRKFRESGDRVKASIEGTSEIAFAALAASAAIIAIFLPIGFMEGIVGKYFFQFAITITIAICFSYIDAVTLTPMRTSVMMGSDPKDGKRWIDGIMLKLEHFYEKMLKAVLTHKFILFIVSGAIFATGFWFFSRLPQEFVPPQDQSRLFIIMKTKPGSSLEYTDQKVAEVEKILMEQPEIQRYFVSIGGFGGNESNSAVSYVTLQPIDKRAVNTEMGKRLSQQEFANYLRTKMRERVKGIVVIVQDPSLGGFSAGRSSPVEFSLVGPDYAELVRLQEELQKMMEDSGLMQDPDTNYKGMIPELRIVPDREKAIARGVSVQEIGQTIQAMVSGVVAGKFAKGGRRYDVRVKILDKDLKEIKDISKIRIRNNRGELIALSEVTKIVEDKGLLSITREDRSRSIAVFSNVAPGATQGAAIEWIKTKGREILPDGYAMLETGASKTFAEGFGSLIMVFGMGIMIAYMVLASQFNSFIHPVTILMSLPFSFTGAFVALWLGGQTLNIYSMIGLILLMGIVKKNAIILVDYTNQLREEGLSVREALMKACPIRLRPIVMTSISTVAGTIPAAIGGGVGSETRVPMALAVIGGVLVSTLLTLLVIPAIYELFSREKKA